MTPFRPALRALGPRRGGVGAVVAVLVVLAMVGSSAAATLPGAPAKPSGHPSSPISGKATSAGRTAPAPVHPLGPVSNGRGTFFVSNPVPFPANAPSSIYGTLQNNSNDPSLNLTSNGVLGVAYTLWTNSTACANVSAYAQTEVGFSSSTNGGATWSAPRILSNGDCSVANQYVNAWQPSLASLSNGTLVLAYIQYNVSLYTTAPYTAFGQYSYWNVPFARLVLTESYTNGATWTAPTVLNASSNPTLTAQNWIPERPWISAFGQTVYVTWMNYSQAPYGVYPSTTQGSSQVHLLVSTNGGGTWGSRIDLPDVAAGGSSEGINPFVMTGPTGTVYVAYTSNITWWNTYGCASACLYSVFTANILVGVSTNNGSTFAIHNATRGSLAISAEWGSNEQFLYPAPQLSRNPVNGQLYLAYTGGLSFRACNPSCSTALYPDAFLTNSSTNGATWSAPRFLSSALNDPTGFQTYNVAIATSASGVLQVETTWIPQSDPALCYATYQCPQFQLYLNSSDNGTTFSAPITIWDNATYYPYEPDGEYDTLLSVGQDVIIAWSHEVCPTGACYYPSASGSSQVTVSSLYLGAGVTLTYQETGLKTGTSWTVDVGGNPRAGNAPTTLSVSGVPPSFPVNWTVGSIASGYGTRYGATQSITPPASLPSSTTIYENFSEQVLVNVTSTPYIPSCATSPIQFCWDSPASQRINYNITATPGPDWVNLGATVSEAVVPTAVYGLCTFCYLTIENLSFLSWTGDGAGSVNTSSMSINITANGPVNESANFRVVGDCTDSTFQTPNLQCTTENATLLFHENGLPAATPWTVSAWGFGNQTVTNSSSGRWLGITSNVTIGITSFDVWTMPDGVTGKYWVGNASPVSPVELPGVRVVNVNFTAVFPGAATFSTTFNALGLPTGAPWSLTVNGVAHGLQNATFTTPVKGGSQTVNASASYETGGTSYYPTGWTVEPFVSGAVWQNLSTFPSSYTLDGPAIVWVTFSPEYWLTVSNSTGGTAGPTSEWVHSGGSVTLAETPQSGFLFVGWSGSGSGQVTTSAPAPRVTPTGPVTELATFEATPPTRYSVLVQATGLPGGATFTLGLGATNFTGGASFAAAGLLAGDYALALPIAYENGSNLTRFLPNVTSTSFPYASAGVLSITANGWINVSFTTQYVLTVSATPGGTVTPGPGTSWVDQGASVVLTAAPSLGFTFAGWVGTGSGSVGSNALQISPMVESPVWESAQFLPKPTSAPSVYALTVSESGLPSGVNWSFSIGAQGSSASGTTLLLGGLNGSYTVTVPTVYDAAGTTRYVPTNASWLENVTQNRSATVTFATQYLLAVTGSTGGTVTAGGWEAKGSSVELTAVPSGTGWELIGWNGTGAGSRNTTAASVNVTMNGPVTEAATFGPVYPPATTSGSSSAGQSTALIVLAIAAIVGLVVGLVIARRRAPTGVQPWQPAPPPSGVPASAPDPEPRAPSGETVPEPAIYDEGVP